MNSKWLTDPFHFIAGGPALILGLMFIATTAVICTLAGVHLDGVIDAHYGPHHRLTITLVEGLINFFSMAIVLTPIAYLIGRPGFRLIDLLGTQAFARAPFMLVAILMLLGNQFGLEQLGLQMAEGVKLNSLELAMFMGSGLFSMLFIGWAIYWMYRSFVICTHSSGGKAIAWFMVALVAGELLSKVLLQLFYAKMFAGA